MAGTLDASGQDVKEVEALNKQILQGPAKASWDCAVDSLRLAPKTC
jgi:hypothetical protein